MKVNHVLIIDSEFINSKRHVERECRVFSFYAFQLVLDDKIIKDWHNVQSNQSCCSQFVKVDAKRKRSTVATPLCLKYTITVKSETQRTKISALLHSQIDFESAHSAHSRKLNFQPLVSAHDVRSLRATLVDSSWRYVHFILSMINFAERLSHLYVNDMFIEVERIWSQRMFLYSEFWQTIEIHVSVAIVALEFCCNQKRC